MREFISNNAVRQSFLDSLEKKPTRAQKHAATTTRTPETEPPKKHPPVKLEKWQVMLDQIFVQWKGKQEAETIQRICPTLLLEKHQH